MCSSCVSLWMCNAMVPSIIIHTVLMFDHIHQHWLTSFPEEGGSSLFLTFTLICSFLFAHFASCYVENFISVFMIVSFISDIYRKCGGSSGISSSCDASCYFFWYGKCLLTLSLCPKHNWAGWWKRSIGFEQSSFRKWRASNVINHTPSPTTPHLPFNLLIQVIFYQI